MGTCGLLEGVLIYINRFKVYFLIPFIREVFTYNFVNIAPIKLRVDPFESVGLHKVKIMGKRKRRKEKMKKTMK